MTRNILQPKEELEGGKYTVIKRVFPGNSYSQIYLVKNNRIPGAHFLKINLHHDEMDLDSLSTAVYKGSKDDPKERTEKEVNVLAELQHPYIIGAYDKFDVKDGYLAIVFEPLTSTHDYYEECFNNDILHLPLRPPAIFKKLFSQMIEAVDFIKEKGYLHRDIKPENILIESPRRVYAINPFDSNRRIYSLEEGWPGIIAQVKIIEKGIFKLIDFGLATKVEDNDGNWGSILYQPPEIYRGEQHPNSDLWSLGLTLFEYLTYQTKPLRKQRMAIIHEHFFGLKNYLDNPIIPRFAKETSQFQKKLRKRIKNLVGRAATSKRAAKRLENIIESKFDKIDYRYKDEDSLADKMVYSLRYLIKVDPDERNINKTLLHYEKIEKEVQKEIEELTKKENRRIPNRFKKFIKFILRQ